jgi:hypothetical protein
MGEDMPPHAVALLVDEQPGREIQAHPPRCS